MFKLSGFADEISPDLDVQLDTLESLGLRYLEFRGVWDKNVLALTDDELEQVKSELRKRGISVMRGVMLFPQSSTRSGLGE